MPSPSFDDEFDDSIFDSVPDEVLNGSQAMPTTNAPAPPAVATAQMHSQQPDFAQQLRLSQQQLQDKNGELANIRRLLQDTQVSLACKQWHEA